MRTKPVGRVERFCETRRLNARIFEVVIPLKNVGFRFALPDLPADGGGKFMKGIGFVRKSEEGAGVDEDLHLAFFFHP